MKISDYNNPLISSTSVRLGMYFGIMVAAVILVVLITHELFVKIVLGITHPLIIIGLCLLYFGANNLFFYIVGVICFSLGCGASFGTTINLFFYSFDMSERLITCLALIIFLFSYSFIFKFPVDGIIKDLVFPVSLVLFAYICTFIGQDLVVIDRKPEIIPKYSIVVLIFLIFVICVNLGFSSVILKKIHPIDISFYKSYYSYTFFIGFVLSCFISIGVFLIAKKALLVLLVLYFTSLLGSYLFMTFNVMYNPELGYKAGVVIFRQIADVGFGFSTSMGYILILMLAGKILDDKAKKTTIVSIFIMFFIFIFVSFILTDIFMNFDIRHICVGMILYSAVFALVFLLFGFMGYLESKNTKDSIVGEVDRNINKYRKIDPQEVLTPKEKVVFDLLLEGMTLRQIAGELSMKYDSVNFHYKNIYRKLEVNSKIELILRYSNEK